MKDTYWLVLGIFGLYAAAMWLTISIAKQKTERLRLEGALRQLPKKEPSIWTRDLLDTRFGRFFAGYVLSPVLIIFGILDATSQEARWKGFSYHGFDAICIGIGVVCIGIVLFSSYGMPVRTEKDVKLRAITQWTAWIVFVVCFGTALFRNI